MSALHAVIRERRVVSRRYAGALVAQERCAIVLPASVCRPADADVLARSTATNRRSFPAVGCPPVISTRQEPTGDDVNCSFCAFSPAPSGKRLMP
jgi:hypothetical protein